MTDLSETPAVPPLDPGGSERVGLRIAGVLLAFLGFGLGVVVNVWVHVTAATGGTPIGPWRVYHVLGPYAWSILVFGVVTGLVGTALAWIAGAYPKGPTVLPGYPY